MKTLRLAIGVLIALWGTSLAHAEPLYVIELLYVTVNSAADGSGDRVGQIKSGDEVELIERQDDQAHVRLPSGAEGWVKASYLSSDPPLRQQVTLRQQEIEKLRKEKTQLETDLSAAKSAAAAATAAAKAASKQPAVATTAAVAATPVRTAPPPPPPEEPLSMVASTADSAASGAPPLFEDRPMMPSRPSWLIAFAAVLVALGAGFLAGWRVLDRRIRAKYGGLRIY